MYEKLLAPAVLLLACAAGGGCAMCDANYPYGPTAGGYYGRAGSVLEPMPYGAIPQGAPGQPVDDGAMQAGEMQAEEMQAEEMEAESMPIE